MIPYLEAKDFKTVIERIFMLVEFLKSKIENYEIREFQEPVPFVKEDYSLDSILDRNIS
jgi:hypothetical protein